MSHDCPPLVNMSTVRYRSKATADSLPLMFYPRDVL